MLVYQGALSKPLDNVIQAYWKSQPYNFVLPHCSITEERGRVMVVLQKAAKTIHQCQISASNPFICESFCHIPYVDTLHFLRGSQKCFAGVSHNRSLIKSMKITLLLSGMQFVEFSTSVDAF